MKENHDAALAHEDMFISLFIMLSDEEKELRLCKHYEETRRLLTIFHKLIIANSSSLEEMEKECQDKIHRDLEYALKYLAAFYSQLKSVELNLKMHNTMLVYALAEQIRNAIALVRFYAPNGNLLSEILEICFCTTKTYKDDDVMHKLGIGRTCYYREKKKAIEYLGFYFYEYVVPQA